MTIFQGNDNLFLSAEEIQLTTLCNLWIVERLALKPNWKSEMILMSLVFFRLGLVVVTVYLKLEEDLSKVYRIYELRCFPNVFILLKYKKTEAEFNI